MAGRDPYSPLDVRCPTCRAVPGGRCTSVVVSGRPLLRRPHAERVTAARTAEERRRAPRVPAGVTDAWTCPDCGRSYWPPKEWEPGLWGLVRAVIQSTHGSRHQQERAVDAHRNPDQ